MSVVLGVALGPHETRAALNTDGRVGVVPLGPERDAVPTTIFVPPHDAPLTGEAAVDAGRVDPDGLLQDFLWRLSDPGPIVVAGQVHDIERLVASFIAAIVERVEQRTASRVDEVVVVAGVRMGAAGSQRLAESTQQQVRRASVRVLDSLSATWIRHRGAPRTDTAEALSMLVVNDEGAQVSVAVMEPGSGGAGMDVRAAESIRHDEFAATTIRRVLERAATDPGDVASCVVNAQGSRAAFLEAGVREVGIVDIHIDSLTSVALSAARDVVQHGPSGLAPGSDVAPADYGVPTSDAGEQSIDDDVQFTAFRPRSIDPTAWTKLLVFAHKSSTIDDDGARRDPLPRIRALAAEELGDLGGHREVAEDARGGLAIGTKIRVVVDLPGVDVEPEEASFTWRSEIHQVQFRLRARPASVGGVVRGTITVYRGPFLLADISLVVDVRPSESSTDVEPRQERFTVYRKVFVSYSRKDVEVVEQIEAANSLGDRFLRDSRDLVAGGPWESQLHELITTSDVFQLFWSKNAMDSPEVEREWRSALQLARPDGFIRPVWWQDPLPTDTSRDLPPTALTRLHWTKLRVVEDQRVVAPPPPPFRSVEGAPPVLDRSPPPQAAARNSRAVTRWTIAAAVLAVVWLAQELLSRLL